MKAKKRKPKALTYLFRAVSEFMYPKRCIRCGSLEVVDEELSETLLLCDPDSIRRGCFCRDCLSDFLSSVRERCTECGLPISVCECSTENLRAVSIKKVYSSFSYDPKDHKNAASALIYKIKRTDNKDAINFAAYILADRIKKATFFDPKSVLVTYAPRRRLAVRQNGGDHMEMIARLTAQILGCDFASLFINKSKGEQKKKNAEDRLLSAERSIKLKKRAKSAIWGKNIVIIDDIVTSGATLSICALRLFEANVETVTAVTLAKAKKHMAENGVAKGH